MAPARVVDRHPLMMRALGRGFANAPIALAFNMIFGAALPDVVGELMVVPLRDHRKQRVEALEVGVGAIGGVAQPIVGEAHHLARRLRSEEHTSELQSLMRISDAGFWLKKNRREQRTT